MKENNELNEQVKKLSNKLERCYNFQVTFEHMLKTQRNFGDKSSVGFKTSKVNHQESHNDISGIGFNKSKIKAKRWGKKRYEREMKKQEQEKLSILCASSAMKWDILQMVAPMKKNSS